MGLQRQSSPLTSTARAFSMTRMFALSLLAVICFWEAL
jgi:hypothetical protein